MRYRDLDINKFFISSVTNHSGELQAGKIEAHLCDPKIEVYLERHRPSNCCPRAQSLLLHERPVGECIYCYKVTPLDKVNRGHTGWLKMLADTDAAQTGVVAHYAGCLAGTGVQRAFRRAVGSEDVGG